MNTLALALVLTAVHMRPYFDGERTEVILVWDDATGASKSWFYDGGAKKFIASSPEYQLPAKLGVTGTVMMAPYVGADKTEVVLVWDSKSGSSVSWYFDDTEKKFVKSLPKVQLPRQSGAEVMMAPYVDKNGSEVVRVWDTATGKSASWTFDEAEQRYEPSAAGLQLPAALGLKPPVMMLPYQAGDFSEVIQTWSRSTGASINWYHHDKDDEMKKSDATFQLPEDVGVKSNVWMVPYLTRDAELMLVWNAATGASVSWSHDSPKKAFVRSPPELQLPTPPLKTKGAMFLPYVDPQGAVVIIAWDPKTGASVSYAYDATKKEMVRADEGYQLPANPLK
jgi:hypothetical protein